ncbi:hypothetical protein MPSEU_000092000 [Mayamaea pseudoterrestris]|nr:hypothetical protein MPSEU_000092000 [Mayamaea pseudoterrestris]
MQDSLAETNANDGSILQQQLQLSRQLATEILVDVSEDYRSFIFAVHPVYGLMLLKSRDKKKKGSYWEVPGGHLDDEDYQAAAAQVGSDKAMQLQLAGKIGASREFKEETGINIRDSLSRFEPAVLQEKIRTESGRLAVLSNLYKGRLFYFVRLFDTDFVSAMEGVGPNGAEDSGVQIHLSDEHLMWEFFNEADAAVEMLTDYSGGKVSEALFSCLLAKASENSTQTLLNGYIPGITNEALSHGPNDDTYDKGESWSATRHEESEGCSILVDCQTSPCLDSSMHACQATGYVEKITCQSSSETEPSSTKPIFRSCSLPAVSTQEAAIGTNLSFVIPLVIFLLLCLSAAGLVWKRRVDHAKWVQRKSRYFDDDAFVVNSEGLELIDEADPMDLPPVD